MNLELDPIINITNKVQKLSQKKEQPFDCSFYFNKLL